MTTSDAMALADGSPIWSVSHLTKRFGSVTALANVTYAAPAGITALVGANGAGKSTLIRHLLGLLPPTSGDIRVLGMDVTDRPLQLRQLVGYMPAEDHLPAEASAFRFISHCARLSGLPIAAARERSRDILRLVGLDEAAYRPLGGYSTGMKQRAKLAQAIVHSPALVLLDEPTNGLDPAGRDEMLDLIRRCAATFQMSLLVSSHLMSELQRISDHVIVLAQGSVVRAGPLHEFANEGNFTEIEVIGPDGGPAPHVLQDRLVALGAKVSVHGTKVLVNGYGPRVNTAILNQCIEAKLGLTHLARARADLRESIWTDHR